MDSARSLARQTSNSQHVNSVVSTFWQPLKRVVQNVRRGEQSASEEGRVSGQKRSEQQQQSGGASKVCCKEEIQGETKDEPKESGSTFMLFDMDFDGHVGHDRTFRGHLPSISGPIQSCLRSTTPTGKLNPTKSFMLFNSNFDKGPRKSHPG